MVSNPSLSSFMTPSIPSSHAAYSQPSSWLSLRTRSPSSTTAPGSRPRIPLTAADMPLPPEVQNGLIVLPEKSQASKNANMIFGIRPHQMGKPTYTVSYAAMSAAQPSAIAGRAEASCCPRFARLLLIFKGRNHAVNKFLPDTFFDNLHTFTIVM